MIVKLYSTSCNTVLLNRDTIYFRIRYQLKRKKKIKWQQPATIDKNHASGKEAKFLCVEDTSSSSKDSCYVFSSFPPFNKFTLSYYLQKYESPM